MSDNDIKSRESNANLPGEKLARVEAIAERFNGDNRLENRISKLRPDDQKTTRDMQRSSVKTLAELEKYQTDQKPQKTGDLYAQKLERYMRDPALRPSSPDILQQDMDQMRKDADKSIERSQKFYYETQERALKSALYNFVRSAEQSKSAEQSRGVERNEPEMER